MPNSRKKCYTETVLMEPVAEIPLASELGWDQRTFSPLPWKYLLGQTNKIILIVQSYFFPMLAKIIPLHTPPHF